MTFLSTSASAPVVEALMPQMGVSVSEGTIIAWRKQVGDAIAYEDTICEISTDKIDTEVPSPTAGVLVEILVEAGETVPVGTPLAKIATEDGRGDSETGETADGAPAPRPAGAPPTARSRRYSPVVQRIAAANHIELEHVHGSGRNGRVRKQDVLAYLERQQREATTSLPLHTESPYHPEASAGRGSPAIRPVPVSQPRPGGTLPDVLYKPPQPEPLSRMRRSIGEHMKRSLSTAATCTTWIEVDFTRVERARQQLRVTALPIVARCTTETLAHFPSINAWLEDDEYTQHTDVNLGIAVSLGEDGLVVPVIRSAQLLSVEGVAARVRDLARRARERKLSPDEVQAGTFTITNPGQYGAIMATPVINQPQVAILDLEAVVRRPVVVTDEHGNESIAIRPMCILGLSWDHRALDGVLAAQFLGALKQRIEEWR